MYVCLTKLLHIYITCISLSYHHITGLKWCHSAAPVLKKRMSCLRCWQILCIINSAVADVESSNASHNRWCAPNQNIKNNTSKNHKIHTINEYLSQVNFRSTRIKLSFSQTLFQRKQPCPTVRQTAYPSTNNPQQSVGSTPPPSRSMSTSRSLPTSDSCATLGHLQQPFSPFNFAVSFHHFNTLQRSRYV